MLLLLLAGALIAQAPSAQTTQPPPQGRRIQARDGDRVVVDNDDRVYIVRRRDANIRTIYNRTDGWLVVLVDYVGPKAASPDGLVDAAYNFRELKGEWPLGERWDGAAAIEDYILPNTMGMNFDGVGIVTNIGSVQLLNPKTGDGFKDPSAAAVLVYGGAGHGSEGTPFNAAEERQVAMVKRNVAANPPTRTGRPGAAPADGSFTTSARMTIEMPSSSDRMQTADRLPESTRPKRVYDVPAVYPDDAKRAGITGTVILEVKIDVAGNVSDVKVLRGIPQLDAAAIEAVRQYRYEPTMLNGVPIPMITTETVIFK